MLNYARIKKQIQIKLKISTAIICLCWAAIVLLPCCVSLPMVSSYWGRQAKDADDIRISYYDSEYKLRCTVSNDSSDLYIAFDTENKGIQRSIFRNGVTIYLDTTAKHSEKMYVRYPTEPVELFKKDKSANGQPAQQHQYERPNYSKFLSKIPSNIIWNNGTEEKLTNYAAEKTGFDALISIDSTGYLYYTVAIPLKAINRQKLSKANNFSVGISLINNGDMNSTHAIAGNGGGGRRGGGGGMGGGGGRMGGGGGRMGGGGMGGGGGRGGGGSSSNTASSSTEPVKIWFVTQLSTKHT